MKTLPTKVLPFIWHFLKKEKPALTAIILLPLVWACASAINPYILKTIIDVVVNFSGPPEEIWTVAALPVIIYLSFQTAVSISYRLKEWIWMKTIPKTKAKIRASIFAYVQNHSYSYFQDHLSGTLSNKVLDIVRSFENILISFHSIFLPCTISVLISAALLATVHIAFGLFVLAWFFIYLLITASLSKHCIHVSDLHSESNSQLSGKIVDAFKNISTIRYFARAQHESTYLDRYQDIEVKRAQALEKELFKIHVFQSLATLVFSALSITSFVYAWQKGWVTIGDFTFITTTTLSLTMITWWVAEEFVTFFKELGVSRQALTLIITPQEILDTPHAQKLHVKNAAISFKNVTFFYPNKKHIFKNKSITILPKEKVGLVGFSGSGKTTFAHLILRFFDIQGGEILIDGQNITGVTQESLRENIAMIPQDTFLFHRTLMENIRYGREDATDEEVIEASKKAACHDFILEIKDGYNAIAGEGGLKLSGGQRQRIAIARAILKKAPILILDEATSSLDTSTERKIQRSLEELMKDKTTLVIAHRLSTLSHLDRILVFKDGVIVESGKHYELLLKKGHYAHLWELQSNGLLPEKEQPV
jgi:ATP-binding cassette, subfamily B, bacterial